MREKQKKLRTDTNTCIFFLIQSLSLVEVMEEEVVMPVEEFETTWPSLLIPEPSGSGAVPPYQSSSCIALERLKERIGHLLLPLVPDLFR